MSYTFFFSGVISPDKWLDLRRGRQLGVRRWAFVLHSHSHAVSPAPCAWPHALSLVGAVRGTATIFELRTFRFRPWQPATRLPPCILLTCLTGFTESRLRLGSIKKTHLHSKLRGQSQCKENRDLFCSLSLERRSKQLALNIAESLRQEMFEVHHLKRRNGSIVEMHNFFLAEAYIRQTKRHTTVCVGAHGIERRVDEQGCRVRR